MPLGRHGKPQSKLTILPMWMLSGVLWWAWFGMITGIIVAKDPPIPPTEWASWLALTKPALLYAVAGLVMALISYGAWALVLDLQPTQMTGVNVDGQMFIFGTIVGGALAIWLLPSIALGGAGGSEPLLTRLVAGAVGGLLANSGMLYVIKRYLGLM
jgi:hypothetical protein